MYEELIKDLRNCAFGDCADCPYRKVEDCAGLVIKAADAIEELSKENERFAKMAKVFIDGMNYISDKCADIAGIQAEPPKEETE
jgi:hypothetical protein